MLLAMKDFIRRFNDSFRKFKYLCVKVVFDRPNPRKFEASQVRKILFLRHDNKIGDSVVASFLLRELKKHNPSLQVGVVVGEGNRHLLDFFRPFDQIIVTRKGMLASIQTLFAIRRWKPDLVVDFSLNLKPKTLFLLTAPKAPFVASYALSNISARNVPVKVDPRRWHIADQMGELLKTLGLQNPDLRYELLVSPEVERQAAAWIREQGLHDFICVNLKAAAKMRSLRSPVAEKIVTLLRQVKPTMGIVLLGQNEEIPLFKEIQKQNDRVFIAAGKSLSEQMAIVARSRGVLTPDTAWTHIASAFQVPIVGIFRIDEAHVLERTSDIWAPRSVKSEQVYARGLAPDKPEPDASSVDLKELAAAMERVF